jgi:hypothetical protein
MLITRGEGSIKRGGGKKFSRHNIPKLRVFDQIILKNFHFAKFPNKKGTFEVNLVFTLYIDISLYKKGTLHHKKGHF